MVEGLNAELPQGFRILEGAALHWQTPSPSVSIREVIYRVLLPDDAPKDLAGRVAAFLAASSVPVTRLKGHKTVTIDLRPDVLDLVLATDALWLHLRKGSPALLAAHLLGITTEAARSLEIRKTAALLGD